MPQPHPLPLSRSLFFFLSLPNSPRISPSLSSRFLKMQSCALAASVSHPSRSASAVFLPAPVLHACFHSFPALSRSLTFVCFLWLTSWSAQIRVTWRSEGKETDLKGLPSVTCACPEHMHNTLTCSLIRLSVRDRELRIYCRGGVWWIKDGQGLTQGNMGRYFGKVLMYLRYRGSGSWLPVTAHPSFCLMTYPKSACSLQ